MDVLVIAFPSEPTFRERLSFDGQCSLEIQRPVSHLDDWRIGVNVDTLLLTYRVTLPFR